MNRKVKVGLIGFGCVGQGFYDLVQRSEDLPFEIAKICVKQRDKARKIARENFLFDYTEVLRDPSIEIVVEVIDDTAASFDIVTTALRRGKNVVTANKAMLARHLEELVDLQKQTEGRLLYEAAACGSIPVLRILESYFQDLPLRSVEGILNGSSNYLLTRMHDSHISYEAALERAQMLGFAESDPSLDVSGHDARSKLSILALHAFGQALPADAIFTRGLQHIKVADIDFAARRQCAIKPVSRAYVTGGRPIGWVLPQLVPREHHLYAVENENNAVLVETAFGNRQLFTGRGAGSHPTGSAVLADTLALLRGYAYTYGKVKRTALPADDSDLALELYIRYDDPALRYSLPFESPAEQHKEAGHFHTIGTARFADLLQWPDRYRRDVFIAQTSRQVKAARPLAVA